MQPVTYRLSGSNRALDILALSSLGLFLLPLLIAAGIGLRWLDIPGTEWIASYGVAEDIRYFWLYTAATIFAGIIFAFVLRWKSPGRTFLALDDTGLTYVFMGMRREWPWRDVESASVLNRPFGLKAGRLVISGKFGWKAHLGALFINGLASRHRLVVLLPNVYEAPVADIVAKLTEFRDRAAGTGETARTPPRNVAAPGAAPGQPVTYAKSKSRHRLERTLLYVVLAIVSLVMVPMGVLVYLLASGQANDGPTNDALVPLLVLLLGLLVVGMPVVFVVSFRRIRPSRNFLALGADGLTYTIGGKRRAWPWRVLSAFEYQLPPSILARPVITFAAPGKNLAWLWPRLIYGLAGGKPPVVVIEDTYETPLDEITAALNARRESALAGGPPGPRAPEPA